MKKFILFFTLILAASTMQAQDEILQKYTQNGDVSTTVVSKNHLDRLTEEQRNLPGLTAMLDHIDQMTILTARKITNIAKQMRTKLPKQLASKGYKTRLASKVNGIPVTLLQSTKDPNSAVLIIDGDIDTNAILLTGDFSEAAQTTSE